MHADQELRQRLRVVEARIAFFGSSALQRHYASLLRELEQERRRLLERTARGFARGGS